MVLAAEVLAEVLNLRFAQRFLAMELRYEIGFSARDGLDAELGTPFPHAEYAGRGAQGGPLNFQAARILNFF